MLLGLVGCACDAVLFLVLVRAQQVVEEVVFVLDLPLCERSRLWKRWSLCLTSAGVAVPECVESATSVAWSAASWRTLAWSKADPRRCSESGCTGSAGESTPVEAGAVDAEYAWVWCECGMWLFKNRLRS